MPGRWQTVTVKFTETTLMNKHDVHAVNDRQAVDYSG